MVARAPPPAPRKSRNCGNSSKWKESQIVELRTEVEGLKAKEEAKQGEGESGGESESGAQGGSGAGGESGAEKLPETGVGKIPESEAK